MSLKKKKKKKKKMQPASQQQQQQQEQHPPQPERQQQGAGSQQQARQQRAEGQQQQLQAPAQHPHQHAGGQPQQRQTGGQQQHQQQSGTRQQQRQPGGGQQQQPQQQQSDRYQLESLTHLFVHCPVAVAVWAWFAGVWRRVQQDAAVDYRSARILLLDDSTVWQPPQRLCQLWTYLRLLMLESIWVVRCASEGRPFSSTAIIMRFRAALQQQLAQDWLRVQGDIRLDCGVPLSWLRGRNPVMSAEKFEAKWQQQGELYAAVEGGGVRLLLQDLEAQQGGEGEDG
jgi:hypothetical protein